MLFAERLVAEEEWELLRRHERTGCPLGGESFLAGLESALSGALGGLGERSSRGVEYLV